MSVELSTRIRLGLDELTAVRAEMSPLSAKISEPTLDAIQVYAACALLHSYYTEIEKIFKVIARDWDKEAPSSDSWHRDLLNQMTATRPNRPPVISAQLATSLDELLAFRHLYRGASIMLMRWNKLGPLVAKVDAIHADFIARITQFLHFISARPD
jgi:hypothetical protein